jgi:hypothetical protein
MPRIRRSTFTLLAVATFYLCAPTIAQADPVFLHTSFGSWARQSGNFQTTFFADILPPNTVQQQPGNMLTFNGFTFASTGDSQLYLVNTAFHFSYLSSRVTQPGSSEDGPGLRITFPGGVTSFNVILSAIPDGNANFGINVNGQLFSYPVNLARNASVFVGFTSPNTPITSAEFYFLDDIHTELNLSSITIGDYVPPAPVPEPATMILLGTGIAAVAIKARGKAKRAESRSSGSAG